MGIRVHLRSNEKILPYISPAESDSVVTHHEGSPYVAAVEIPAPPHSCI